MGEGGLIEEIESCCVLGLGPGEQMGICLFGIAAGEPRSEVFSERGGEGDTLRSRREGAVWAHTAAIECDVSTCGQAEGVAGFGAVMSTSYATSRPFDIDENRGKAEAHEQSSCVRIGRVFTCRQIRYVRR